MNSILNRIKKSDFENLVNSCGDDIKKPFEEIFREFERHIKIHKKELVDDGLGTISKLESRWYDSLSSSPDYSVYSDPFYICDIWLCWLLYSRKGLLELKSPRSLINQSVVNYMSKTRRIVDLGCGFAFTTAALKEMFPSAEVIGTNLEDTFQYRYAKKLSLEYGFKMMPSLSGVGDVDLVFASEYFEHIERPIEHLFEVIKTCSPKYFIIANGFNGRAIGHFNFYKYQNQIVPNKTMNKWFNDSLKHFGYEKIKTKIWNNRPSVWKKI